MKTPNCQQEKSLQGLELSTVCWRGQQHFVLFFFLHLPSAHIHTRCVHGILEPKHTAKVIACGLKSGKQQIH